MRSESGGVREAGDRDVKLAGRCCIGEGGKFIQEILGPGDPQFSRVGLRL